MLIPVNIAVISIKNKDKRVMLEVIPISKEPYNVNLDVNEKDESVSLTRTKFLKYVTKRM